MVTPTAFLPEKRILRAMVLMYVVKPGRPRLCCKNELSEESRRPVSGLIENCHQPQPCKAPAVKLGISLNPSASKALMASHETGKTYPGKVRCRGPPFSEKAAVS